MFNTDVLPGQQMRLPVDLSRHAPAGNFARGGLNENRRGGRPGNNRGGANFSATGGTQGRAVKADANSAADVSAEVPKGEGQAFRGSRGKGRGGGAWGGPSFAQQR